MADEAGPSGSGTGAVPPEKLEEATSKFERAIQCIRVSSGASGLAAGSLVSAAAAAASTGRCCLPYVAAS